MNAADGRHGAGGRPRHGDSSDGADSYGARFWVTAAIGWLVIGAGVRGVFLHHVDTRPRDLAAFVVGGALLHDLLFAPLVVGVGVLLGRVVPARWRAPVQAALIVGGVLALFAYPLVRGFGRAARNPTSLPRDYGTNLVVVVALVWLAMAVGFVLVSSGVSRARAKRPAARRRP